MSLKIIRAFQKFLPCVWNPTTAQENILSQLVRFSNDCGYAISEDYEQTFIEAVNQKLDLNRKNYKQILDQAFLEGIKLNYVKKMKIKKLLDRCDIEGYKNFLKELNSYSSGMISVFHPINRKDTLLALNKIFTVDSKYKDVYCSIFSRFCFNLFSEECTSRFFSGEQTITKDYYSFLSQKYPDINERSNALCIIDVSQELFKSSYSEGCNIVLNAIKWAFRTLNNHCELAIHIPQIFVNGNDIQWKLFADTVLYAEKHNKEKIDRAYFKWQKIGKQTLDYIKNLSAFNGEFEYAFQGFVFRDSFILGSENNKYSLLLILEKNVRDERIVNCPACRSSHIQGNSYPILNVKSWECENPLCPDRSKYNRGKRYSFLSLFRQKEMMNDDNIIPNESIAKWHLDCQHKATKQEAFDMVIRHYSCVGDGVTYISSCNWDQECHGRQIIRKYFDVPNTSLLSDFKKNTYFYRYLHCNDRSITKTKEWTIKKAKVFCGDSLDVLRGLPENSITGAVTSPPYYNAKSYSHWPNIYCYLYDMYNINAEIFRVIKPGGVLLYNIFDYFDNENNVSLSAMGTKRMILGAYMVDMFERLGFKVCGNIIWNKGEIQGNRSFNQGNMTPYYQAPLNCWEHIFILAKGEPSDKFSSLTSSIRDIKPVIKMVRGKNVLGHEAPYPDEIPSMLIDCLDEEDTVLDPFLGSGTTCIVANKKNVYSVGIEKNKSYFELCQRKLLSGFTPVQNNLNF